jgi:hypothetical protein
VTVATAAGPSAAATSGGGGTAATPECSAPTAAVLVDRHRLNSFLLPNPVRQVLCGPFTGAGSEAMAVTIGAPTCWPVQRWAVFRFVAGGWQLVLDQTTFVNPPLVAVGSDLQETGPVYRPGDARCLPSGGTRARIWRWDGTRLVAGPWRQVTPGAPLTNAAFRSPSANIECAMIDRGSSRRIYCQSFRPPQTARLNAAGRVTTCRGSEARCRIGNAGEQIPTLAYGGEVTVGRFRCASLRSGVRCTIVRTGRGFVISRSGVRVLR